MFDKLLKLARGIRVSIVWEDVRIEHRAHCVSDAIDWLACYPANASGAVTQWGRVICKRM